MIIKWNDYGGAGLLIFMSSLLSKVQNRTDLKLTKIELHSGHTNMLCCRLCNGIRPDVVL